MYCRMYIPLGDKIRDRNFEARHPDRQLRKCRSVDVYAILSIGVSIY